MTSDRLAGHEEVVVAHRSPAPTIPQCCAVHRLAALDAVEALVTNDVMASFDRMVQEGWSAHAAIDALHSTYRSWILGRLGDAIDIGLDLLDLEVAA